MRDGLPLPPMAEDERSALADAGIADGDELLEVAADFLARLVVSRDPRLGVTTADARTWLRAVAAGRLSTHGEAETLDPLSQHGWEVFATFTVYLRRRERPDGVEEQVLVSQHEREGVEACWPGRDLGAACLWLGQQVDAAHPLPSPVVGHPTPAEAGPGPPTGGEAPPNPPTVLTPPARHVARAEPAERTDLVPGESEECRVVAIDAGTFHQLGPQRHATPRPMLGPGWRVHVGLAGSLTDYGSGDLVLVAHRRGHRTHVPLRPGPTGLHSLPISLPAGYHDLRVELYDDRGGLPDLTVDLTTILALE